MRVLLTLVSALLVGFSSPHRSALADSYPSRPVRIILPASPGGSADGLLRAIAQRMGEGLKGTFFVDNRPGANGIIGTQIAAKAPPDGHTLVMSSTSSFPMNAAIYTTKLAYDPVKDFTPVASFLVSPFVLIVNPDVPANSVAEFIALVRSSPGTIPYSSHGIGSASHFGTEIFSMMAGVKLVHVPYKGSAPSTAAVLTGEVKASFDTMQNAMPYVRAQRLRALGIASLKRSPAAPDLPTIAESGLPGLEVGSMFGLMAPAGTPREIVNRLHVELARVVALPEINNRMTSVGTEPVVLGPDEFAAWLRDEMVKWAKVARDAKITAD